MQVITPSPGLKATMQFTPEVKEELQEFLVKELTPISTAKPSVLAEYVSALLKKGQTNLAGSLQEFLKDHTEGILVRTFMS